MPPVKAGSVAGQESRVNEILADQLTLVVLAWAIC